MASGPQPSGTGTGRRPDAALVAGLYLTALALLAGGIAHAFTVVGGAATFGSVRWRFGFLGVVFLSSVFPLLGMALGSLTAAILRHRGVLRALAVLQGLLGIGMALGLVSFVLDATELAGSFPAPHRGAFWITVAKTSASAGLAGILLLLISLASWHSYRIGGPRRPRGVADRDSLGVKGG